MSDITVEMHDAIVRLAGPRSWSDNRKSWLAKAARAAGIKPRVASMLFYREVADPKYSLVERVRTAVEKLASEQGGIAKDEYRALDGMLGLDDAFVPHMARPSFDAMREEASDGSRVGGSVDQGGA